jgi:hypothetical protein
LSELGSEYTQWKREFYINLFVFADAHQTFSHFFDLPTELRNTIYGLLCASDSTPGLEYPELPAICQASKRLRSESLSVFFSQNRFLLVLHFKYFYRQTLIGLRPVDQSWLMCNAIHVPLMRSFAFSLSEKMFGGLHDPYMCLTLSKDAKSATVRRNNFFSIPDENRRREERPAGRLQEAINRVVSRGRRLDAEMLDGIIATMVSTFRSAPAATRRLGCLFLPR